MAEVLYQEDGAWAESGLARFLLSDLVLETVGTALDSGWVSRGCSFDSGSNVGDACVASFKAVPAFCAELGGCGWASL